jgi:hypothetical protein
LCICIHLPHLSLSLSQTLSDPVCPNNGHPLKRKQLTAMRWTKSTTDPTDQGRGAFCCAGCNQQFREAGVKVVLR